MGEVQGTLKLTLGPVDSVLGFLTKMLTIDEAM
jgi:hypothetical protein